MITTEPLAAWATIVSAAPYIPQFAPKAIASFLSDLAVVLDTQYGDECIAMSADAASMEITTVFRTRLAAEAFRNDWYKVRARILAQDAAAQFGVDPDDLPF